MTRARPVVSSLLFGLVFAACGGDGGGPSVQDFCANRARLECVKPAAFCPLDPKQTCEPLRAAECTRQAMVSTGAVRQYRPENTSKCLETVESLYATDKVVITGDQLRQLDTICARVFLGGTKKNQPCVGEYDCDVGLVCDKGYCGTPKVVGPSDNCGNPGETCPAGLTCQAAGVLFVCQPKRAENAACGPAQPCLEAYYCRETCLRRRPSGATCAADDECDTGYCSPEVKVCTAGLSFSAGGPSCLTYGGTKAPAPQDAGSTSDAL